MIKARQAIEVVSPEPIGGRNLLRYSETVERNVSKWRPSYPVTVGTDQGHDYYEITIPADSTDGKGISGSSIGAVTDEVLYPDTAYTYSFWMWCTKNASVSQNQFAHFQCVDAGGSIHNEAHHSITPSLVAANTWTRVTVTFSVAKKSKFLPYFWFIPAGATARYSNPKVEQGNQPTDWTPAPEDVESHISGEIASARTYSKQLADSITTGTTDIIITNANGQKVSTLRDAHHKITTTSQELSVMQAGVGTILKQSAAGWAFDWQTAAGGRIEFQDGGVIKVGSNAQSVRISDDSVRIGKDTQYQLITDDETIFYSSGAGDTRITNAGLESKQVSALESLSIGGWKFLTTPDGDLIIA